MVSFIIYELIKTNGLNFGENYKNISKLTVLDIILSSDTKWIPYTLIIYANKF